MRKVLGVFAVAMAILVTVLIVSLIDVIPPDAMTRTRMIGIEVRICDYYTRTGEFPAMLSSLPNRGENYDNSILDGWGRPIQYIKEGGMVTLLSLGKDAQPGGDGQNADIWTRFTPPEPSWISGGTDQGALGLSPTVDPGGPARPQRPSGPGVRAKSWQEGLELHLTMKEEKYRDAGPQASLTLTNSTDGDLVLDNELLNPVLVFDVRDKQGNSISRGLPSFPWGKKSYTTLASGEQKEVECPLCILVVPPLLKDGVYSLHGSYDTTACCNPPENLWIGKAVSKTVEFSVKDGTIAVK